MPPGLSQAPSIAANDREGGVSLAAGSPSTGAPTRPGASTARLGEQAPKRRAAVIAVGNLKGGTGKSTIAVNLGCALAADGHSSVVIDADPQLTSTQWLRRRELPAALYESPIRDVAAVPAWIGEIHEIGAQKEFVIIDLPAVLGATLAASLLVADLVLIPAAASGLDLSATTRTLHRVARAEEERHGRPIPALVVPTRMQSGWFQDGGLRRMRIRVPAKLAPPIRHSPLFAESFDAADWIGGYAPRSGAHRDIVRLAKAVRRELEDAASTMSTVMKPMTAETGARLIA